MIESFVVDASIAVAWVYFPQATPQTNSILLKIYDGMRVEAPAIWPLEVSNALLVLERRRKIAPEERQMALNSLRRFSVKIDHEMAALAFTKISALASEHQLSVYDAAYLELAQRRNIPLACKDGALRSAAQRVSVRLL